MLDQDVADVLFHAQSTGAFRMLLRIVPLNVNACKFLSLPIGGNFIVFQEDLLQMLDMLVPNIFNSKIIHDEDAHYWSPFVSPESHGGFCFIVTCFVEAGAQKIICQCSTMQEPVAPSDNLKVYPTIMSVIGEIIFIDKFLRDVSKFDSHIFRSIHRSHEVEVLYVKACKFSISS